MRTLKLREITWLAQGTQPVVVEPSFSMQRFKHRQPDARPTLLIVRDKEGPTETTKEDDCTLPKTRNGCVFPVSDLSQATGNLLGEAWLCTQRKHTCGAKPQGNEARGPQLWRGLPPALGPRKQSGNLVHDRL